MDLSALGPAGAGAIIVYFFLRYLRDERISREKSQAEERAARKDMMRSMAKSIDHNTRVSEQTYDFLKNLNGELKKAAQRKLEHQGEGSEL